MGFIDRLKREGNAMQVVVLAGGVGSRLRPWTNQIPKPLLPMLDKTLLERVVEGVPNDLVDEVIVAGGYKIDMIRQYFADADVDFDVTIVPEDEPLGTGGALANCSDLISGTFACFNGDIVSSLDVTPMIELHKRNGGIGTLALWEVEDPTRFGIVGLDDNSRITQFKEKPKKEEVFSNLINAGSYILEDDIFDFMHEGKHSIEREVFPVLAEKGKLNGMQFDGYFVDAGTPESWSEGVQECIRKKRFSSGEVCGGTWFSNPMAKVTEGARVVGSMVEGNVGIGNSEVIESTILSGSLVGDNSVLSSCLIGRNATIGNNCNLEGVVVDHNSIIPPETNQIGGKWLSQQ